jgi:hypothetical protein
VRAHPYVSSCFICRSSRQATIVSRLKWNMLRLFHRHDQIVACACASVYNRTFHLGSTIVAATKTARPRLALISAPDGVSGHLHTLAG